MSFHNENLQVVAAFVHFEFYLSYWASLRDKAADLNNSRPNGKAT